MDVNVSRKNFTAAERKNGACPLACAPRHADGTGRPRLLPSIPLPHRAVGPSSPSHLCPSPKPRQWLRRFPCVPPSGRPRPGQSGQRARTGAGWKPAELPQTAAIVSSWGRGACRFIMLAGAEAHRRTSSTAGPPGRRVRRTACLSLVWPARLRGAARPVVRPAAPLRRRSPEGRGRPPWQRANPPADRHVSPGPGDARHGPSYSPAASPRPPSGRGLSESRKMECLR